MKKLTLLFLLSFAICIPFVAAQDVNISQVDRDVNRDLGNTSLFPSNDFQGIFTNSTFISGLQQLATDADQVARITQEGQSNSAAITQQGTNNIGIIDISGIGNDADLTQNGSGLLSFIRVEGASNELDILQNGNALQNLILIEGTGLSFDILQNAGGVQLTQTGSSIPLQIERTGRGGSVPIIIRNN